MALYDTLLIVHIIAGSSALASALVTSAVKTLDAAEPVFLLWLGRRW